MTTKKSNRLIHATSPYLLQHAYNPVDWHEWSTEALEKAKQEDKPILVSIGYSSCHWCHVMERESFEHDNIAALMNEFFICIKVDREERPDIDQVYMDAVQALGVNGGWPLNVFLTPEQKPFFGGTYFSPAGWVQILQNINKAFQVNRTQLEESAEDLRLHLLRSDVERYKQQTDDVPVAPLFETIYQHLESRFDREWGGLDKTPKFIMPSVWLLLLRYYYVSKNDAALHHVLFTLKKIAMGGIYDQVGGGFARYSVDNRWFAPHFEKMLYDNAQLLSLYAEAYAITKDEEFKVILQETFQWLEREMTHDEGGFYSALDADSEGEEGKYYVWTQHEWNSSVTKDGDLLANYFCLEEKGNWEHGNKILWRTKPNQQILTENNISAASLEDILRQAKQALLNVRNKRTKPGLDDKVITSWNAMMISGLVDAYRSTGAEELLNAALKNLQFLENKLIDQVTVYRSFKGKRSTTQGFLDDYAYLIQACLRLYQVTFQEDLISRAEKLLVYTLENFYDTTDGFFFYTAINEATLIARKKEIFDNVIPSSNSVMAQNLFHLGTLLDREDWKLKATVMVNSLAHLIRTEPNYMSNWAIVLSEVKKGMTEVVVLGAGQHAINRSFQQRYHPYILFMGTESNSALPLMQGKSVLDNRPTIFVCHNKTCQRPVHTVVEAEKMVL